jgi:hypothetical protein
MVISHLCSVVDSKESNSIGRHLAVMLVRAE